MIQIILMLLGLAFPNDNTNTANDNNSIPATTLSAESGSDTGGETGTTLPPKK
ncbi:hypothetical protein [uncultured Chryseobacterium sp.]|uniref:hypothetical protein n=1 Tax=uncultured Chryseobacterium sp. TaxID=259322 RepID=UPI0025842C59|nr:hypothetical protein [uncultured Chryseobacterium sp.]